MQLPDAKPRELVVPARVDGLGDALEGRDVDAAPAPALGLVTEQPQDGKFGAERLARRWGRPDQHILVGVVEDVEGLRRG